MDALRPPGLFFVWLKAASARPRLEDKIPGVQFEHVEIVRARPGKIRSVDDDLEIGPAVSVEVDLACRFADDFALQQFI